MYEFNVFKILLWTWWQSCAFIGWNCRNFGYTSETKSNFSTKFGYLMHCILSRKFIITSTCNRFCSWMRDGKIWNSVTTGVRLQEPGNSWAGCFYCVSRTLGSLDALEECMWRNSNAMRFISFLPTFYGPLLFISFLYFSLSFRPFRLFHFFYVGRSSCKVS